MRTNIYLITLIATAMVFTLGCGGAAENTNISIKTNTANTNGNYASAETNSPVATTKKAEVATTNNAPTLGPVVQAYYDALKRKDDKAIRDVLVSAYLKEVEKDMREENKTSMTEYLASYDTIPEKPVEVRNEIINGSNGVAELKGGAYPNWTAFVFAIEGGKWKLTGGSPDVQTVTSQKAPDGEIPEPGKK